MLDFMSKITIAIDGYSSCGKSTLAKALAAKLGYTYVDSGAMYRCATLYGLRKGVIKDKHFIPEEMIKLLPEINDAVRHIKRPICDGAPLNGTGV